MFKAIRRRIFRPAKKQVAALRNRYTHNHNDLFYTLSPAILPAIVSSFRHLEQSSPHLLHEGAYYEFGIFKGFATWFADQLADQMAGPDFRVFGFDSFEGLPVSSVDFSPFWRAGTFSCGMDQVERNMRHERANFARIALIRGFFSPELFAEFDSKYGSPTPAILVIDSDIYESAKCVLDHFGPRLVPGSIVVFDELRNIDIPKNADPSKHGELRALHEFKVEYPSLRLNHIGDFGIFGSIFCVA